MEGSALLGIGVAAFVGTNIDDLFLLAAFFADNRFSRSGVIAGQFLGIGTLVAASAATALLALAVPEGWVAMLGLVPAWIGLRGMAV